MDPTWLAAIASVASAFVVAVASIAALLQVRHVRNANDIAFFLKLTDRLDSASSTAAFHAIDSLTTRLESDPGLQQRLRHPGPLPELQDVESLVRFLDTLTIPVILGSVSERLVLTAHAENIVRLWESVGSTVYIRRYAADRPFFGAPLEHLAMRARTFIAKGNLNRLQGQLEVDNVLRAKPKITTTRSM